MKIYYPMNDKFNTCTGHYHEIKIYVCFNVGSKLKVSGAKLFKKFLTPNVNTYIMSIFAKSKRRSLPSQD